MSQYTINTQGPCWNNYIYIGPKPNVKGSCVKREKFCSINKNKKLPICLDSDISESDYEDYNKCLNVSINKFNNNEINLCPRGYCTAKHKFEVYPSAYANGYASQVCKGNKPDYKGITEEDLAYIEKLKNRNDKQNNSLNRWYKEKWVNVCEKGKGPGGYAECGTGKGIDYPKDYPYCRAYYKLPGTEVVTVEELEEYFPDEIDTIIEKMCDHKRSLRQGIDGKPTRINLPRNIKNRIKEERKKKDL